MRKEQACLFLKELLEQQLPAPTDSGFIDGGRAVLHYNSKDATRWVTKARVAIENIFLPNHPIARQWQEIYSDSATTGGYTRSETFEKLKSVIEAGLELVREDRVSGLIDGIRAETVDEILEQAGILNSGDYVAAAAVLAGGGLETHLRFLCEKSSITWTGDGSISKYNQAIASARKNGIEIYSKTDVKSVESWGGIRNDAAHTPGEFEKTRDEVGLMIEGISYFIARTGE